MLNDLISLSDAGPDIVIRASEAERKIRFPNALSEFVYTRTYSRWIPEEKRRETWPETVARYFEFLSSERSIPEDILLRCHNAVLSMGVMPSMRALWCAGPAVKRDNTCMYNCSFVGIDSLRSFNEVLFILMQGTGVGFSVESQFVDRLPPVAAPTGQTVSYSVPDSTEGWADAFYFGLENWWKGNKVNFDYSNIRPKGAILSTKGGRASGPEPFIKLMEFGEQTVMGAAGRKLRSLECHDLVCQIAEIVIVGGHRRSSLISFSDIGDTEMRHAKDFSKGEFPNIRFQANNSAFYADRPEEGLFREEFSALANSGSGERGFSIDNWWRYSEDRPQGMLRSNPCHEIGLKFSYSDNPVTGQGGAGQFCNLTAAVMRAHDTPESMIEKVRLATWLGVIQASFTHFPYLREGWQKHCDEDRLLGVDITGQCDNPALSMNAGLMLKLNEIANETAREASSYFGINMPVAITCGKPSGNSSQMLNCASGFHPRYSPYYYRHVRINSSDPLFRLARDQGVPLFKENGQENTPDDEVTTWVARFPVRSPKGAMTRNDETAVEQCNRYLGIMHSWCSERGHNQSATIYVRDGEWDQVGNWLWKHFDEVSGLAFLPHDGGNYTLAPYEEIDADEYQKATSAFPNIDFARLGEYEEEDRTQGAREYACTSGTCELL